MDSLSAPLKIRSSDATDFLFYPYFVQAHSAALCACYQNDFLLSLIIGEGLQRAIPAMLFTNSFLEDIRCIYDLFFSLVYARDTLN